MKELALLALLAALALTTFAATPVTIARLETILASQRKQPDAKVARLISSLELTERASSTRLARWQENSLGKQTQDALLALADASAFLDVPKSEIPSIGDPDVTKQDQLLASVDDYAKAVVSRSPSFFVRRNTTLIDDLSPLQQIFNKNIEGLVDGISSRLSRPTSPGQLHVADRATRVVTYRDGQEVSSVNEESGKGPQPSVNPSALVLYGGAGPVIVQRSALTTSGEFGPLLAIVVGDALRSQISWHNWEQGPNGPLAVFRYAVPPERSNYSFTFEAGDETQFPAYHGEIAVDPESGAVFRLTVVADLNSTAPIAHTAILVEYGPVVLGNDTCICPKRAVALSSGMPSQNVPPSILIEPQKRLSDITFTEYSPFSGGTGVVP